MSWIRVESSVRTHRKFLAAGPAASWLWLCGNGYCQDGLTDGFIPIDALFYLGVKDAEPLVMRLVEVHLWDVVEGGWQVHDYLEWNKDAETIRRVRTARGKGGALGGRPPRKPRRKPLSKTLEANLSENPARLSSTHLGSAREDAPPAPLAHVVQHGRPIVEKRRLDATIEGPRGIYVPNWTHSHFLALRGGREQELIEWYKEVFAAFDTGGSRSSEEPGSHMLKFWDARYAEKWPAPGVKLKDTGPVYTKAHEHRYAQRATGAE